MGEKYTISQVAKAAEIPTTTVRYYERAGLVEPDDRSAGNYRLYGEESLQKLRFIRAAQAIGFTLDDIKALLEQTEDQHPACRDVQVLIEERLSDIKRKMKDLRHVQGVLQTSLDECQKSNAAECCHVIETLEAATKK